MTYLFKNSVCAARAIYLTSTDWTKHKIQGHRTAKESQWDYERGKNQSILLKFFCRFTVCPTPQIQSSEEEMLRKHWKAPDRFYDRVLARTNHWCWGKERGHFMSWDSCSRSKSFLTNLWQIHLTLFNLPAPAYIINYQEVSSENIESQSQPFCLAANSDPLQNLITMLAISHTDQQVKLRRCL